MKYVIHTAIFFAILCSTVFSSKAQSQSIIEAAPGRYLLEEAALDFEAYERVNTLWSEDFANGLPSDWESEASPSPAAWEYRGPGTNPSNVIGTRGSCLPAGSLGGDPIASPTAANGFMIFDSNYWDDAEGPCGSFGTGSAPGPHLATLTSPSLDLSASPNVGIEFYQYHKNFQAATTIQASIAGGEWVEIFTNTTPLNNGSTPLNDYQRKNVSSFIGGQADVRLRFSFDGNYYFWMIDDIALFELSENNLVLQETSYGDFNPDNPDHITGYEFMEYSQYPVSMPPLLKLSGKVANYGYANQTNVALNTLIFDNDGSTVLFDADDSADNLAPEGIDVFRPGTYQLPAEMGNYELNYSVVQTEEESEPEDNVMERNVEITEFVYSRDRLETNGIYFPPAIFDDVSYEVGNMFVITGENQACHSVSAGVSVGSTIGSPLYAAIYKLDVEGGLTTEEIAMSNVVPLEASAYNTIGTNHVQVIPFNSPVELDKDSVYLVVVGAEEGPNNVLFPLSGTSPNLTSFVRYEPNTWFYLVRTPLVRMNFGPVTSVDEFPEESAALKVYPNPAHHEVKVAIPSSVEASRLYLYNSLGQVVKHQLLNQGGELTRTISTNELESGVYQVVWEGKGQVLKSQLIIQ